MKKILSAAVLCLLATGITFAQGPGSQAQQQARIREGVATGELTRPEAARLRGREAAIRQDKRRARADGYMTRGERQRIRREKMQTSRAIQRQKHDAQVRY